jgi:hypothetical protein
MSADPWEPWLTELEGACDAGEGGRLHGPPGAWRPEVPG